MASNQHRNLTGEQLHNPKGFDGASPSTTLIKNAAGDIEWRENTTFDNALDYVSPQSAPPTEVEDDIYLLDDTGVVYDIDTIAWQSGNTIRYTFNGTPNLSAITAGDYLVTSGNGNSSNDGTFVISAVNDGSDYIEITNANRSDATDDEASDAVGTAYYTLEEWDGASKGSHIKFDGTNWNSVNAQDGAICYDETSSSHRIYNATSTNWDLSLTTVGAGAINIVDDTTPQLGGNLDANGFYIDMGTNNITDTKVGQWDTAYGWGDHSTQGYVTSTSEANNRIAVFTGADAIEGVSTFTYDSATTSFKVSSPSDDDYSEMTNNGITQVRSTNDSNLNLICYGDQSKASEIQSFKYRGDFTTQSALQSGDLIASHRHIGYDGTAINTSFYSKTFAAENWSGSAAGVYHVIDTCATGETSAVERFRIESDGNVKISSDLGIGTSAATTLHASGSGEIFRLESSTATGDNKMTFHDAGGEIANMGFDSASNDLIIENSTLAGANGSIIFKTDAGSGSFTTNVLKVGGSGDTTVYGDLICSSDATARQFYTDVTTYSPTGASPSVSPNFNNDGSVIIIDCSGVTSGNVSISLSSANPQAGASYLFKLIQGSNSTSIVFPTAVKFAGETAPYTHALTTASGSIDVVAMTCISDSGTVEYLANVSQNYG